MIGYTIDYEMTRTRKTYPLKGSIVSERSKRWYYVDEFCIMFFRTYQVGSDERLSKTK